MTLDLDDLPRFPCGRDKAPLTEHGFKDAAFRPYRRWPLVGVPTGAAIGFDVVDIDPRHGGHLWLAEHPLPPTLVHRTRGGGWHFFLKHAGVPLKKEIAPGVEPTGSGRYVIWWPREGFEVEDRPVADWPGWLLELARKGTKPSVACGSAACVGVHVPNETAGRTLNFRRRWKAVIRKLDAAPKGSRNAWLYWASCRMAEMVAEGLMSVRAAAAVLEGGCRVNGLWADPADGPERCRATIASAFARVEQDIIKQEHTGAANSHATDGAAHIHHVREHGAEL